MDLYTYEMIELTLQITTFFCYLGGLLLISLETIFGRVNLLNFFANKIRIENTKYIVEISRFIIMRGIVCEENIIAKIGIFLTLLAIILSIFLLIVNKLNLI